MNMEAEFILKLINSRKNRGQKPIKCLFDITTPRFIEGRIEDDETMKEVISILNKYNIRWNTVDTIPGSFCLDREWVEVLDIPCYIEYSGVYPVEWDIEDIYRLEQLEYEGKIMIHVRWHRDDGGYEPNH